MDKEGVFSYRSGVVKYLKRRVAIRTMMIQKKRQQEELRENISRAFGNQKALTAHLL